jgi:hypothetical protein
MNRILTSGMPSEFKYVIVIMSKKCIDAQTLGNYIPFSKQVSESKVASRLSSYHESEKIFDPCLQCYKFM